MVYEIHQPVESELPDGFHQPVAIGEIRKPFQVLRPLLQMFVGRCESVHFPDHVFGQPDRFGQVHHYLLPGIQLFVGLPFQFGKGSHLGTDCK